ncbi:predicted protein [Streptomyces iranensis]|uniref:Uncharacterized protein n=1 Tax=Streptomyces iranensis TaxID=576784 RepID=A0A060ZGD7_9ACTN|nr:predicted protein [Streptomyces iranensis]CDR05043.1 predicted protein [Streptomyces iranensis]
MGVWQRVVMCSWWMRVMRSWGERVVWWLGMMRVWPWRRGPRISQTEKSKA